MASNRCVTCSKFEQTKFRLGLFDAADPICNEGDQMRRLWGSCSRDALLMRSVALCWCIGQNVWLQVETYSLLQAACNLQAILTKRLVAQFDVQIETLQSLQLFESAARIVDQMNSFLCSTSAWQVAAVWSHGVRTSCRGYMWVRSGWESQLGMAGGYPKFKWHRNDLRVLETRRSTTAIGVF